MMSGRKSCLLAALWVWCCWCALLLANCNHVMAFTPPTSQVPLHHPKQHTSKTSTTTTTSNQHQWHLFMGKGMNKQAALKKKLELAKKQKEQQDNPEIKATDDDDPSNLSPQEIKERNDRMRFEQLLKQSSASAVLNDYSSDGYLNRQQEEEEIVAQRKGVERIFEGDPAPYNCFQDLLHVRTETPLGKAGMERLVPWLKSSSNSDSSKDYLVILCDPRDKSPELRQSVQTLVQQLPKDMLRRLVVVNADSPAENRRWMKRHDWNDDESNAQFKVYSDEKREFMSTYTALGENRWSMTLFVIANGRVLKLAREVDMYAVSRVVQKAVQAAQNELRV